jgi:hypothetical protein
MNPSKKGRVVVGALVIFGAAVFGLGINWGLPPKNSDAYFFNPNSVANLDSTQAFRTSGTGIDHIAGDWKDDPTRGADVAEHPITDRSKPITLIENLPALDADQIAAAGDQTVAAALENRNTLWEKWKALGEDQSTPDSDLAAIQDQYSKAEDALRQAVNQYNIDHIPGLTDSRRHDQIYQAQLVRRYRLYSYQPDEMITFRALADIHPSEMQFDPRLYQYGGLWIYPIGGILQAGWFAGLLNVTSDRGYYLDHPDEFAKFYIVARAYSALWGLIGMLAIFSLVRKVTSGYWMASLAAILFICMPVVIDLAHEAKPHLAGASLLLLTVLAAVDYIQTGKFKFVFLASLCAGAAAGMVLSAALGAAMIPLMILIRRDTPGRMVLGLVLGLFITVLVYFATNPYVAIHLWNHDSTGVLASNFGNSKAMYPYAPNLMNAIKLLAVGMSPPLLIASAIGLIILVAVGRRITAMGWLLGVSALLVGIQFVIHAGDKPAEYARFALFLDIALMLAAVLAVDLIMKKDGAKIFAGIVLILITVLYSHPYEIGFYLDSTPQSTRLAAAADLQKTLDSWPKGSVPVLGIEAEPAPYNLPPIDLFRWKLVLLPPGDHSADIIVQPSQAVNIWDFTSTPMSWAYKRIDLIKS